MVCNVNMQALPPMWWTAIDEDTRTPMTENYLYIRSNKGGASILVNVPSAGEEKKCRKSLLHHGIKITFCYHCNFIN